MREQVDWDEVRTRTSHSPYARAFFALLGELDLEVGSAAPDVASPQIRVLPS